MNKILAQILGLMTLLGMTSWVSFQAGAHKPTPTLVHESPAPIPADIEIVVVKRSQWQDHIEATGTLTADPNLQSLVGAPVAGRMTSLRANLGDHVQQGQILATMRSAEITKLQADYHHARMRLELADKTLAQRRQLARLGDASRRPVEEARNEYAAARSEKAIAVSACQVAEQKLSRTSDLMSHGIASQQQLEEEQAAVRECKARLSRAEGQLAVAVEHRAREERVAASQLLIAPKILEAESEAALAHEETEHVRKILENYGVSPMASDEVPLRAATSGILVDRKVSVGQWVSAEQEIFQILDPQRLWLWLTLYENDFPKVRSGMPVLLVDLGLRGRIDYLDPSLQSGTRTQRVRVEVKNNGPLRLGMFTRAQILTGAAHQALTIPSRAVQGDRWVYVESSPGHYDKRSVRVGPEDPSRGQREVQSGLRSGERVVSEGAYFLYQQDQNS